MAYRTLSTVSNENATARIQKDSFNAPGEFRVSLTVRGTRQEGADYFTDDKADAEGTAIKMIANYENIATKPIGEIAKKIREAGFPIQEFWGETEGCLAEVEINGFVSVTKESGALFVTRNVFEKGYFVNVERGVARFFLSDLAKDITEAIEKSVK